MYNEGGKVLNQKVSIVKLQHLLSKPYLLCRECGIYQSPLKNIILIIEEKSTRVYSYNYKCLIAEKPADSETFFIYRQDSSYETIRTRLSLQDVLDMEGIQYVIK